MKTFIETQQEEFDKLYLNTHWMRAVTSEELKKESEPLRAFISQVVQNTVGEVEKEIEKTWDWWREEGDTMSPDYSVGIDVTLTQIQSILSKIIRNKTSGL